MPSESTNMTGCLQWKVTQLTQVIQMGTKLDYRDQIQKLNIKHAIH